MLKILICDDHQLYREGLSQLARQLDDDVKVVHAGTYPEIMSIIATGENFDLILADLKMPLMGEMAGIAAVKREAEGTPVVVVSAFESPQNVEDAMSIGAAGFLPKSSPIKVMLDALRQVLAGSAYFPESLIKGTPAISLAAARATNNSENEPARARLNLLTHRQRDVLALVGEGRSNKDIADTLGISEGTVKVHVGAILKALGTTNRTQAALIAIDFGIAQPHHDAGTATKA